MADFEVGDKVRLEGEVVETQDGFNSQRIGVGVNGEVRWFFSDQLILVEKRRPKVGDVIKKHTYRGLDQEDPFPNGTVISHSGPAKGTLVKRGGKWLYVHESGTQGWNLDAPNWSDLTIDYIPE